MELRGDRVVLRPLAAADVPRIVEFGDDADGLLLDLLVKELT